MPDPRRGGLPPSETDPSSKVNPSPNLAREIALSLGPDGDVMQALPLMTERGITDTDQRLQLATHVGLELRRLQEEVLAKKLYSHLETTGRSGVILSDIDEGVEIIGEHQRNQIGETEETEEGKVTRTQISMNGKDVGVLKIVESYEDDDYYADRTFEPAI